MFSQGFPDLDQFKSLSATLKFTMTLTVYNAMGRRKSPFVPHQPGRVRLYVCGMTVYDYCHLGHGRMLVCFDLIARWLEATGFAVEYVRNITDIDDKIIRRAVERGQSVSSLSQFFIDAMNEDAAALNVRPPTHEPRATQYVGPMLSLIAKLETAGLAYQATSGDVNFAVREFPGYGRLSGRSLDELRAGERVGIDPDKRDPLDFVLWKASKADEPDDARWDSPYGWGRPGWHIECSAMSTSLLGTPIDIHGGGPDLKFPHHENEIAQSEGALGTKFVNYWMHNGPLLINNEKMSKSLGNFFTIREVLQRVDPEVLRFFFIRTHYRSPQQYSPDQLGEARQALARLYTCLDDLSPEAPTSEASIDWSQAQAAQFRQAMDDDFNTPLALTSLFALAGEAQRQRSVPLANLLKALGGILGLLQRSPRHFLQHSSSSIEAESAASLDEGAIQVLITERAAAKQARDFTRADAIRDQLLAEGILLEDRVGQATVWRRA